MERGVQPAEQKRNRPIGSRSARVAVWSAVLVLVGVALIASSCASKNPYYPSARSHHTQEGFRNNYGRQPGSGFWKWKWDRLRDKSPKRPPDGYHFALRKPDAAFLQTNRGEPTLTWVGHATLLLQLGGVNIVTDPHFSPRASPVDLVGPKRVVAPALEIAQLPHIDIVLLSHNHYDHLDVASVVKLNRQPGGPPLYFLPLGMRKWFAARGIINVVEMDWWEQRSHMGLEIAFTPMQHWSKRTLWDANQALWGGWYLLHPRFKFLFLADTGYSKDFADIYARYGAPDLAAIPIGHYEPRWFMQPQHVNPPESVRIHRDLHARQSVGVHWGTFEGLTDEYLDEPPRALKAALDAQRIPADEFFLMQHGETRHLVLRGPAS
jgi:N-acyl-phosphatidylethanolamine-hydrolysing phospholipase D